MKISNGTESDTDESEVRYYSRLFPVTFRKSRGSYVYASNGNCYLDFFCGAGALNYGHNNPEIKEAVIKYLKRDGICHSLDMLTEAKVDFLRALRSIILEPRGLSYRVQFTGPTGTNAIEAALKLARRVTGRRLVVAFTGGFHGLSLGALALTANRKNRQVAGVDLNHNVLRLPFDGYVPGLDSVSYLEILLDDPFSGIELPSAIVLETVQIEGGINIASSNWIKRLFDLAKSRGIITIVDDIQAGCGRSGPFFSFERYQLKPDLVALSKSIGGMGMPLSLLLIRPDLDQWQPGEHNGTFRGNNLAFVAGSKALGFWRSDSFQKSIEEKGAVIRALLDTLKRQSDQIADIKGCGMIYGLQFKDALVAIKVAKAVFERGLLIETCGSYGEVLKICPALTASIAELEEGISKLTSAIKEICQ